MSQGQLTGSDILAKSLKSLGVDVIFGIVGVPVVEVAEACIAEGIRFIGCRNEQSASFAAGAWGYLNKRPGVCLTVSGPGVVNAISGLYNAQANCWPMILIGGSCETNQIGMGAFQELDQVDACRNYTKFSGKCTDLETIPFIVNKAYQVSKAGRPGPTYVDLPADLIQATTSKLPKLPEPFETPYCLPHPKDLSAAIEVLKNSKRPLLVVGKGATYSRCENELKALVEDFKVPFLPTPMAKGILPDSHSLNAGSARSLALRKADVIVLLGARLNWMMQFGNRLNPQTKIIHVDISPEEFNINKKIDIGLFGNIPETIALIHQGLKKFGKSYSWVHFKNELQPNIEKNQEKLQKFLTAPLSPLMNHQQALNKVEEVLSKQFNGDYFLVSEGARTMDVTRMLVSSHLPRRRLDAGTLGVMGIGLGYALAGQLTHPDKKVVAIMGDSAFGFSAMEIETAARCKLPLIIIIINNNGIYHGLDDIKSVPSDKLPSFTLMPETRYDLLANSVYGQGFLVKDSAQLQSALQKCFDFDGVSIVNVMIDHRPASEGLYWLTREFSPAGQSKL